MIDYSDLIGVYLQEGKTPEEVIQKAFKAAKEIAAEENLDIEDSLIISALYKEFFDVVREKEYISLLHKGTINIMTVPEVIEKLVVIGEPVNSMRGHFTQVDLFNYRFEIYAHRVLTDGEIIEIFKEWENVQKTKI